MPIMPIEEFMDRFGPSNEGSDEVTGTWEYELVEQLKDPESNRTLVMLLEDLENRKNHGLIPTREPVTVDFNPDRMVDGHSRVLALKLLGFQNVLYGTVV